MEKKINKMSLNLFLGKPFVFSDQSFGELFWRKYLKNALKNYFALFWNFGVPMYIRMYIYICFS